MFLGEYQHSLDPKGRVVLPAKFRKLLEGGCVIAKGQERCLSVFSLARWETEVERVNLLPRTDVRARKVARSLFASADRQTPDKQGRIQIPLKLREYAGLDKDVAVVGVADRVEMWDAATWNRLSEEADDYYSQIEEALSEHGI